MCLAGFGAPALADAGGTPPLKVRTKAVGCIVGQACKMQLRSHRMASRGAACLSREGGALVSFMVNAGPARHRVRSGDVVDVQGPACAGASGRVAVLAQPRRIVAARSSSFYNAVDTPITAVLGQDVAERYHAANVPGSTIPAATANYYLMYGLYPYGLN
jgi:hypothetical protein